MFTIFHMFSLFSEKLRYHMLVALSFKVLLCDGRFPSYQFLGIGQVVVCDFIISGIIKYVKCAIVVRYASRCLCCCRLNLSKQLLLR